MTDTHLSKPFMSGDEMATKRLIQSGLIGAVVASAGNLLVYYLVPALFNFTLEVPLMGPGSEIQPLPAFMVLVATFVAATGGAILLAILNRFTARPAVIFRRIAVVLLLLSFAGLLPLTPLHIPLTLATMHVIAAAVITYALTRQARTT